MTSTMNKIYVLYVTWRHLWGVGDSGRATHNKEYIYRDLLHAFMDYNKCRAFKHVEYVQLVEEYV